MTKYKYYLKKPKSEIAKDVLTWVAAGGVIAVAATSPYFIVNILRTFKKGNQYDRKQLYCTFYRLRKEGQLKMGKKNHQIYISLTEKGRHKAGMFQINHLRIKKPKRWDKKWRIVIFDITHEHRVKREALRGLLKRLNFFLLQKSVWICPYDCRDEIALLKDFFGLNTSEIRLVVAESIGADTMLKKKYNLQP